MGNGGQFSTVLLGEVDNVLALLSIFCPICFGAALQAPSATLAMGRSYRESTATLS